MEKELLEDIRSNRHKYGQIILDSLKNKIYECERYKVNFSLAIGATLADMDIRKFSEMIRETDEFIILDKNVCCIVFPFTDHAQGIKAASNLLSQFEMKFFSQKIYLSVANTEECPTPDIHIQQLFDILVNAISNGMNNMPIDSTSF
jgi:hypothetical protein